MGSKTRSFCPYEHLEGEQLRFPPSNARLFSHGSLPPLLGQDINSCPATKGAYPLGIPTDLCLQGRPQIRQSLLGFRLRSPLGSNPEEPCPLSLQTVFSPTNLRRIRIYILPDKKLCDFQGPSLILSSLIGHQGFIPLK